MNVTGCLGRLTRSLRVHLYRRRPPDGGDAMPPIKAELVQLSELLRDSPVPVYLTGGVSFALQSGRFDRYHHDFDLVVRTNDILALNDYLKKKGHFICHRLLSTHISARYDLMLIRAASRKQLIEGREPLRIVRRQRCPLSISRSRLDYIDVFRMQEAADLVHFPGDRITAPREEFYPIREIRVDTGAAICCPNVHYMMRVTMFRDRQAVAEYLSRRPDWP